MKQYHNAIHKAAQDTAAYMTASLRQSALQHGWHPTAAKAVSVKYAQGEFQPDISPKHKDSVLSHEYGTETTAPTAVMRKFGGNSKHIDQAFLLSLEKHVEGLL